MMQERKIDLGDFAEKAAELAEQGKTPLFFAEGEKLLGILGLADPLKPTSKEAVDSFHQMGIDVVMLTGDNKRTANTIASQLGIQAIAEVLPQDKEMEVRRLQESGKKVAMIGDGINDAPALTRCGCRHCHRRRYRCCHGIGRYRADEKRPSGCGHSRSAEPRNH